MTDEEITKVVKKLVGSTHPIADTRYDEDVLNNITLMLNVVDSLICNTGNNVIDEDSRYASVARCKERMMDMFKTIKEHIDEYLEGET